MTQDEMVDRIRSLEHNLNLLAEQQAQYAHLTHLIARQIKEISFQMDVDFEPRRMN